MKQHFYVKIGGVCVAKLVCNICGEVVVAKVTENLGYQGGNYVKAVEFKGKEYIVAKYGNEWRTRRAEERLKMQ